MCRSQTAATHGRFLIAKNRFDCSTATSRRFHEFGGLYYDLDKPG